MTDAECLVLVDLQRAFVLGESAVPAADLLMSAVSGLLDRAREAGARVVFLQNDGPPGALDEPGTVGWELAIQPKDGEFVVRKTGDDGFEDTDLAGVLDGIGGVVIAGLLSEMCVAATARSAIKRGLHVVLPHDTHATNDVPAGPGQGPAVPAALAARAAEWSLGDEVQIPGTATEVSFQREPASRR